MTSASFAMMVDDWEKGKKKEERTTRASTREIQKTNTVLK